MRWQAIDGTVVFDGFLRVWADGNEKNPALSFNPAMPNVVLLPRIIGRTGGPQPPG